MKAERRGSVMESVLKGVEDHVVEYRTQEWTRQAEVRAQGPAPWAEAGERNQLLAEVVAEGEDGLASPEEVTADQHIIFVPRREDPYSIPKDFDGRKNRLVNLVLGKGDYGSGKDIEGIRGSRPVFEAS